MLMQMSVAGMILKDDEQSFSLLLKEMDGATIVSIQIDQLQAEFIVSAMDKALTRIPDPYDFLRNIMDSFELRISRVIIKNPRRYTKNADVYLTDGARELRIDSHAGDAVASALLMNAPIFVDRDFLGASSKKVLQKWLRNVRPSDFGEIA